MPHTVLITDAVDPVCTQMLEAQGAAANVQLEYTPAELKGYVRSADGWIVRSGTTVTAELIDAAENLTVVGRAGVGVDNIDLEAATRRGVLVCNAPGGNTISTAEHACALLMALARQIPQAHASLQSGAWERKNFSGQELHEKTIGIVGVGKVGRAVAQRMQGFEVELLGFDPVVSEEVANRLGVTLVPMGDLLQRSDFITVHAPLNDETRGLIGQDELAVCKAGVGIVNCARGGIVDEEALLEALNGGPVGAAALDVYSEEPPPEELNDLVRHPRVVATPHIAATTGEAQEKVARQITRQVLAALDGGAVSSPVNGMGLRMAAQPEVRPYLKLANRLGQIAAQLAGGQVEELTVTCAGEKLHRYAEVLRLAATQGVLGPWAGEPVNLINAPVLAKEMGLRVTEERTGSTENFTTLLEVTVETGGERKQVAGTVFNDDDGRLVRVEGYGLEVRPEGRFLFYRNVDRPGVLARACSLIGEAGINIAALALGRDQPGARALTAIRIDDEVPKAVIRAIEEVEGVEEVRTVQVS